MDIQEAVEVADAILFSRIGQHLSDLDVVILRASWTNQTYEMMASNSHWSEKTLKERGASLWRRLSEALDERVGKKSFKSALARQRGNLVEGHQDDLEEQRVERESVDQEVAKRKATPSSQLTSNYVDWGDAPDVPIFFGRTEELAILEQRVLDERDRLIAIVGLAGIGKTGLSIKLGKGGIGKTDLSLRLAQGIQHEFDYVIWRSLLNAPPIEELLNEFIQFLSNQHELELPSTVDRQISKLLQYLRQHRCLLILDNFESVLRRGGDQGNEHSRRFDHKQEYEQYSQLLKQIGQIAHQSCLLITSRETPQEVAQLEGYYPVYRLALKGLDEIGGRQLFSEISSFDGSEADWKTLIDFYDGNPLVLEVVARHIDAIFDGHVADFLATGSRIFDDLKELLDWHFQRLTLDEQEILYWLAINREPISLADLKGDISLPTRKKQAFRNLELLQRQLPLERVGDRWTLQPVLIEYVTERLIDEICHEIEIGESDVIVRHALLKAQAKDFVKESQVRVILRPIVEELKARFINAQTIESRLQHILTRLKDSISTSPPGYGPGNLINLYHYLGISLEAYDFSNLTIWQADLQDMPLHRTNFAGADFTKSVFAHMLISTLATAFDPTGRVLAVGDISGTIWLYRISDGQLLCKCQGHTHWIRAVTFSPDGQRLVSGSWDWTVRVWEVQTGRCLKTFQGHHQQLTSVAFSPNGKLIASSSYDGLIKLWSMKTGQCIRSLQGCDGDFQVVFSVCFSVDGKILASGAADATVKFWDIQTGRQVKVLDHLPNHVWALAWEMDTVAVGCSDGSLQLWQVSSGQCLHTLEGHAGLIFSIAFSPDGQMLASSGTDGVVKLWNTCTGQLRKTLRGHQGFIWSVAFSPDAQSLVSGSFDRTVRFWDIQTGQCLKIFRGYYNIIFSIEFLGNNRFLMSNHFSDNTLRLWDLQTGDCVQVMQGHTDWITGIGLALDPLPLDSPTKDHTQAPRWPAAHANESVLPRGTLVTSGHDSTIRLWDLQTGQCLRTLIRHTDAILRLALSSDGQWIIGGGIDRLLRVWCVRTGECLKTLQGHSDIIDAVACLPDSPVVASSGMEKTIRLWDINTETCIRILDGHADWIWALAFAPSASNAKESSVNQTATPLLASGSHDTTIRIWDIDMGECLNVLQGHTNWVISVVFSPNGRLLASASHDATARIWDVQTGECLKTFYTSPSRLMSIAFSPDGKILAASGENEKIWFWQIESGELIQTIQGNRLYEGMTITGATGLTEAQKEALIAFGAIQ